MAEIAKTLKALEQQKATLDGVVPGTPDLLTQAIARSHQTLLENLAMRATAQANMPISQDIPGYGLLYIEALRKIAERKIGRFLGRNKDDSLRLNKLALEMQGISSKEDLIQIIQANKLPGPWVEELYVELLPFFIEVYRDHALFSPTDLAILIMTAKTKIGADKIASEGIGDFKGSVVLAHRMLLLYGSMRKKRYWPDNLDLAKSDT